MKNKLMKVLWLILALLSLGIGVYETITAGFKQSYRFYIFFIIAISVYFLRRNHRDTPGEKTKPVE